MFKVVSMYSNYLERDVWWLERVEQKEGLQDYYGPLPMSESDAQHICDAMNYRGF